MPEWWHGPVLDQSHATVTLGPIGQPSEAEFGPPAESARYWRKADFECTTRPRLCADMIDQYDLTAWPYDTREFVERGFGLRHRRDDELCHDDIKGPIRQCHPLGIHHRQRFDIGQFVFRYAFVRFTQHGFGQINANQPVFASIFRKRNTGAHTDFEDAPAGRPTGLLSRFDRSASTSIEHRTEDEIVDRCPSRIGTFHARFVDISPHAASLTAHDRRRHALVVGALMIHCRNRALDKSAAEHTCLAFSGIIKHAGLARRYTMFAIHQLDLAT